MNAVERIENCRSILDARWKAVHDTIEKEGQANEPPGIMLERGVIFARNSLFSVARLIDDPKSVFQAGTICRSYFELAVRLLWASRQPNGWHSLQAYWAQENKRFSKHALDYDPKDKRALDTQKRAEEVLSRRDGKGRPYSPSPNIRVAIMQIGKTNVSQGTGGFDERSAKWQYAYLYVVLSRHVHAHMTGIHVPDPDMVLNIATLTAIYATFLLLQAIIHVSGNDLDDIRSEIQILNDEIAPLLQNCNTLRFSKDKK